MTKCQDLQFFCIPTPEKGFEEYDHPEMPENKGIQGQYLHHFPILIYLTLPFQFLFYMHFQKENPNH